MDTRAPDRAPQREALHELDPNLSQRLSAPARVEHHAQHAVDAEPRVPEAGSRCRSPRMGLLLIVALESLDLSLELLYLFSQLLDSVANATGHKQPNDRQHEPRPTPLRRRPLRGAML